MKINRNAIAAVSVAGLLAAGFAIPAIAQDDAPEDTTTSQEAMPHEDRRAEWHGELAAALADELDLETTEVVDALEAVHEQLRTERQAVNHERVQARLDELVESGELTQEEADTLADVRERGVLRDQFRRGPGGDLRGSHGPGHGLGWRVGSPAA